MSPRVRDAIANLEQAYANVEDRKGDYLGELSAAVDDVVNILRESKL